MFSTLIDLDAGQLLLAYQQAVDANIISSITDTKGTIIHVNHKFVETSKFSASELVGQNHNIVNSGTHAKQFFAELWRTIAGGDVWKGEIKNKAKDGSYYWVDTVIVPIKSDDGMITNYLSLRTLITARKELELENERRLASLEALLVMTSQRIHRPLSRVSQQLHDNDLKSMKLADMGAFMTNVKTSVGELDTFTRELSTFIRDMKV
jgi:PAS domain S-box-containing protein